jgi:RNA polymerase sigma-70 factor, ECF subfamily
MEEPSVLASPNITAQAASFEDLVVGEQQKLYGALCLLTRDRGEAEDLMQEAFLRVWERWDRVGALEDPTGYLYRTALNLYRKRLRRAKVALRRAVGAMPPRDGFQDVDERDEVVRALGRLTERQRTSVVLVDLFDYSSEEAGRTMGVSASTVRVLASQGRAAIRHQERDDDD